MLKLYRKYKHFLCVSSSIKKTSATLACRTNLKAIHITILGLRIKTCARLRYHFPINKHKMVASQSRRMSYISRMCLRQSFANIRSILAPRLIFQSGNMIMPSHMESTNKSRHMYHSHDLPCGNKRIGLINSCVGHLAANALSQVSKRNFASSTPNFVIGPDR